MPDNADISETNELVPVHPTYISASTRHAEKYLSDLAAQSFSLQVSQSKIVLSNCSPLCQSLRLTGYELLSFRASERWSSSLVSSGRFLRERYNPPRVWHHVSHSSVTNDRH
jgi:hypothetical protein